MKVFFTSLYRWSRTPYDAMSRVFLALLMVSIAMNLGEPARHLIFWATVLTQVIVSVLVFIAFWLNKSEIPQ